MLKHKIEILLPAMNDIEKIADYYLQAVGPSSAEKITDELFKSIESLGDFPMKGPEHSDSVLKKRGFRKLISGEYICTYRLVEDVVYIYRVFHESADYPKLLK